MKKFGLGSAAAAGAVALVLGLSTSPAMAAGTFDTTPPTISGTSNAYLPYSTSSKKIDFTVTLTGPGAPYSYAWGESKATMIERNKKIKSSYVQRTFNVSPVSFSAPTPGANYAFTGTVYSYITTPGKYRISVPVLQKNGSTVVSTRTATKNINIKASPTASKSRTSVYASGVVGRTWNAPVTAPYYQAGAKVAIYAKLKGQSSYHKATASKTLANSNSSSSKATLKIPGKYTKKGTRFYVKVSSAPYAPGYKRTGYKIS